MFLCGQLSWEKIFVARAKEVASWWRRQRCNDDTTSMTLSSSLVPHKDAWPFLLFSFPPWWFAAQGEGFPLPSLFLVRLTEGWSFYISWQLHIIRVWFSRFAHDFGIEFSLFFLYRWWWNIRGSYSGLRVLKLGI